MPSYHYGLDKMSRAPLQKDRAKYNAKAMPLMSMAVNVSDRSQNAARLDTLVA